MRVAWVEGLLIVAIILIPTSLALRVIYGSRLLEWEYGLVESWGISLHAYILAKLAALVGLAAYWLIRRRRRRQRDQADSYVLPKH